MKPNLFLPTLFCAAACAAAEDSGHTANTGDAVMHSITITDPRDFIKPLELDQAFSARVWAAGEPVANIVAMDVDHQNRLYAAQTFRFRIKGVVDVREALFLYRDDLRARTLADRAAFMKKWTDQGMFKPDYFTKYAERVSLLQDTKGQGAADRIGIFAGGFNDPLDGTASGILVGDTVGSRTTVYLACIPKVWALTDSTGTGVADQRVALSDGYGPRFSFSGHDLHGLVRGPDGRVYWSVGDRGYDVTTKEGGHLSDPTSGAVFRSEPDGSDVELYYTGLRNPEELAFNASGDLFTVDNNADMGDASRVNYILEGGTSGWTHGWQLLRGGALAKAALLDGTQPDPWLEEGMWKERFVGQPAHLLPPVGFATNGPCGLAVVPATGWPADLQGRFLVADYHGGTGSGVLSFLPVEQGAGFTMDKPKRFVWGLGATDVTFDYAGNCFVSDYLGGWAQADKGAIIAIRAKGDKAQDAAVEAVRALVAAGFGARPVTELRAYLGHADQRVRQFAQFELARRGQDGLTALIAAATANGPVYPRLHGIWGIGQIGRHDAAALTALLPLLRDAEPHVREQAAKMLGDDRCAPAASGLIGLLKDPSARVRAFACIALGRIKAQAAIPELLHVLSVNDDQDAWLRHAAVMGLVGASGGDGAALARYAGEGSKAVRMGVLLALRRLGDAHIATLLADTDPGIRAEAVRAIYDVPIAGAMPALIAGLAKPLDASVPPELAKMLTLRLINATQRYGDDGAPAALVAFAAGTAAPPALRAQALVAVARWPHPTTVDPVIGLYRPGPPHEHPLDAAALKEPILRIIASGERELLKPAVMLAAQLGYGLDAKTLLALLEDRGMPAAVRTEALRQLAVHPPVDYAKRLGRLLDDASAEMRIAAFDALVAADPAALLPSAQHVLEPAATPPSNAAVVVVDRAAGGWEELAMHAPAAKGEADSDPAKGAHLMQWVDGFAKPGRDAGAAGHDLPRLTSAALPRTENDGERAVWADGGESRFVLDLSKPIAVAQVDTYSWHKSNRAQQMFVLWGAGGDHQPATSGEPGKAGWTSLAKVDTSPLGDGGKHGSAVRGEGGDGLGRFRWLMWQNLPRGTTGTFYAQIDVFAKGHEQAVLANPGADRAIMPTRQHALLALGASKTPAAGALIGTWFDRLVAGTAPAGLALEITDAAKAQGDPALAAKLEKYRSAWKAGDALALYRDALLGGDSERGRAIFTQHAAQCIRCHAVDGEGGTVGPDLRGAPNRLSRDKILESLIMPSAEIAPGYGLATLTLTDGTSMVGGVLNQDANAVVLRMPDGTRQTLPMARVAHISPPVSPMPPMGEILNRYELRDAIAYVMSLR